MRKIGGYSNEGRPVMLGYKKELERIIRERPAYEEKPLPPLPEVKMRGPAKRVDWTAADSPRASGRKVLVEEHRASEHLFKPAGESAHGNSSAMKWEQHGASYVARHGDTTYRVSVAAKGGFDAFVDKPDGTVVRLRGGLSRARRAPWLRQKITKNAHAS